MTRGGHSSSQILQRLNRQKALSQKAQTSQLASEVFAFHVRNKLGGVQEAVSCGRRAAPGTDYGKVVTQYQRFQDQADFSQGGSNG